MRTENNAAQGRLNDPGWTGRDDRGRQQCDSCGKWQFPVIHSCTGIWGGSSHHQRVSS